MRAVQLGDFVPQRFKRPADLAVAAFAHDDDPLFAVVGDALERQLALAIIEVDAKITDHLLMERFERPVENHFVALHF